MTGDRESTSVVQAANVMPTPPHPLDGEWYVHLEGETYGPYSGHVIRGFIADGRITPETDVMRTGRSDWTDAASDKALAPLFAGQPLLGSPKAPPVKSGNVAAAQGATVVQVTNNLAPPERSFAAAVLVEDGPAAPKSAGTALILSVLLVGLGQMYNGQIGKGILMLVLCVALWFVLLGWIINIWSWIDAYQTAAKMNDRYLRRLSAGVRI